MNSFRLKALVILLTLLFFFTSSMPFAQKDIRKKPRGSAYVRPEGVRTIPAKTEKGIFTGTWYYVDRDMQFAFFIKEEEGQNKIKIRWKMSIGEEFETGWDGRCQYMFQGYEGKANLKISNPHDKNELKGDWEWVYTTDTMTRTERAAFTIYRAEDGRKLVWMFPDFERIIQGEEKSKIYAYEDMHILRKVSERIVDWDDIPF